MPNNDSEETAKRKAKYADKWPWLSQKTALIQVDFPEKDDLINHLPDKR